MHTESIELWQHDHVFGQDRVRTGERRALIVLALTATMMVGEIAAGVIFGSMALLADGLHMASHSLALAITAFAYLYARRHARDRRFSFGTGKVNALAGFSSALLLVVFALMMTWESVHRLISPVEIFFNRAIAVAFLGLAVNAFSVVILKEWTIAEPQDGHQQHQHQHQHHQHDDHNLRAAYLHVLADALTSVLAIFALSAGKFFGLGWMDPLMGIVGAVMVSRWSWSLLRNTSEVLLDRQAAPALEEAIRKAFEADSGTRVADLHLWCIGPGIYAAAISIVVSGKLKSPEYYKGLLPRDPGLAHTIIEICPCSSSSHEP